MADGVNPESGPRVRDLRAARVADTQARILHAATELFLAQGYPATTLAAVAQAAGVAERTVYLHFGTKAALLRRAVDVAIAGDTEPIDVTGRPWYQEAMTAPTATQRIAAMARGGRGIMERAGRILAVAFQAEPAEPAIAAAAHDGRTATRDSIRRFWQTMAADGLLPPDTDLDWLADTTGLLAAAETYLLITRTLHDDPDRYQTWLDTTLTRLATAATQPATPAPAPTVRSH